MLCHWVLPLKFNEQFLNGGDKAWVTPQHFPSQSHLQPFCVSWERHRVWGFKFRHPADQAPWFTSRLFSVSLPQAFRRQSLGFDMSPKPIPRIPLDP